MTSSSSLYGSVTTQNSSSSNSTSLYGEAGTPIPDSSGNVIVRGDLYVLSGNILTTATTGNIFPANATTINLGLAATAVNIGAGSGTTTVNNDLDVSGDLTINGTFIAPDAQFGNITIAVADDNTITTTTGELRLGSSTTDIKLAGVNTLYTDQTTFQLLNSPTTVTAFNGATSLTIGDTTGTTTIRNDLAVQGDVTADGGTFGNVSVGVVNNNTINNGSGALLLSATTGTIGLIGADTLYTDQTTFNLLNSPTTVYAFRNATTLELGEDTGTTGINNDLRIDGTDINIAQGTSFLYSEAGDRANRPEVQSTSGNTSGFRIRAPNTGTSAASIFSVNNSSDSANTEFLAVQARGSALGDTFRFFTGEYIANVLNASNKSISFTDNTNTYATVNPAGPTIGTDLTTKAYVDSIPNTTYTIDATSATGGANFNLTGSDATTDTVKFASGTGITVARTDANTITITNSAPDTNTTYTQNISSTTGGANLNLVGSDATTDTVKFANGTGVTVSYTDASTATVAIGQPVATTDAVTFASVAANGVNVGLTANTISGNPLALASNTAGGGSVTTTATDSTPGSGTGQLTIDTGSLTYTHTDGALVPGVTGTWSFNPDGTTNFPSYKFPYADGTVNQVLTTDGAGNVTWALPGGGGSTFGNITVGVDTDNTIGTTSGDLILDSASGILQLADANLSSTVAQTWTVVDNTASALSIGATGKADILKIVSTNGAEQLTTSAQFTGDSASLNRFIRTNNGTGSNAILELSRNRADAARAVDGGPWLGFAYVGTDNTQTNAVQNAIQSRYQTAGNHQLRFIQFAGDYAVPTVMGQVQRGNTFFNTTGGVANLFLSDTVARVGGTTTTITNSANTQTYASLGATSGIVNQDTFSIRNNAGTTTYATFASGGTDISGAGLSTITRTTVGTPGVVESRPSMNIQLIRSDQAGPTSGDGTGFRSRVGGSNGTIYTISDLGSNYSSTGDVQWALQLANGDQTTSTFSGLQTIKSKISETTIAAGTPSATPGASTVSTVATFGASGSSFGFVDSPVLLNRTTAGTPGVPNTKASYNIEARRSDQAGVTDGDAVGAGFRVGGTANYYWTSNQSSQYDSAGDHAFQIQAADGDRTAGAVWLNVLDSRPTQTIIYAGTTSSGGGGSTSAKLTVDNTKITAAVPVVFPSYTAAAANAITGAVGWQIAITDSAGGSNPNGMMAFWDTTHARWSYIHDNTAV